MEESPDTFVVQLDEDELDALERRLTIAVSRLTPGAISTVRGVGGEITQNIPQQVELEAMVEDILNRAKTGVRIAPLVESHPLIPLFRAAKIDLQGFTPLLVLAHLDIDSMFCEILERLTSGGFTQVGSSLGRCSLFSNVEVRSSIKYMIIDSTAVS